MLVRTRSAVIKHSEHRPSTLATANTQHLREGRDAQALAPEGIGPAAVAREAEPRVELQDLPVQLGRVVKRLKTRTRSEG
jgi:hypothetical protein